MTRAPCPSCGTERRLVQDVDMLVTGLPMGTWSPRCEPCDEDRLRFGVKLCLIAFGSIALAASLVRVLVLR